MRRRSHLKLITPVMLIVLTAMGLIGWKDVLLRTQDPAEDITVVAVRRGSLFSAVTASGTLEPRRTVDIKYDAESPVDGLLVRDVYSGARWAGFRNDPGQYSEMMPGTIPR